MPGGTGVSGPAACPRHTQNQPLRWLGQRPARLGSPEAGVYCVPDQKQHSIVSVGSPPLPTSQDPPGISSSPASQPPGPFLQVLFPASGPLHGFLLSRTGSAVHSYVSILLRPLIECHFLEGAFLDSPDHNGFDAVLSPRAAGTKGCVNRMAHNLNLFSYSSKTRSPKSRCWHGWFPLGVQ